MGYLNELFFEQKAPFERLAFLRISLGLVCLGLLLVGPYNRYYVDAAPFMFEARFPFYGFPNLGTAFWTLKSAAFILAALYAVGWRLRWVGPLFTLCWLSLNYYTFCFHQQWDVEHAHLNFFLIALLSVDTSRTHLKKRSGAELQWASFILAAVQCYIAMLYFQAGLSKLIWGGWSWFSTGDTLYVKGIMEGTQLARALTAWPWLFSALGIATALFEFGAPLLFFWRRAQAPLALIAISFHLGTFLFLGISFWFLWALFPAIWILPGLNISASKQRRGHSPSPSSQRLQGRCAHSG